MAYRTALRKDGSEWTPEYVESVNEKTCIGCGRCYKACAHDVLMLIEDEDDDDSRMYMTAEKPGNCIGCKACASACPKGCFTHAPVAA